MKYEAKNVGGIATSRPSGLPWTSITQTSAIARAYDACDSCHLITEAEWLTIAHNVVNVASNWSGGSVGSGYIYSGHNDNNPSSSLAASTSDSDGYYGTGNSSGNQRRTLTLSNGEVIWDLSGNVEEWTSGQISGGQPGASGWNYREWNSVEGTGSLSPNPFRSFGNSTANTWTRSKGIGSLYSNSDDTSLRGFRRGGYWSRGSFAGVFTLEVFRPPASPFTSIGFRVAHD